MRQIVILGLILTCLVTACKREIRSHAKSTPQISQVMPSTEAQAELDKLNGMCVSDPWKTEIEMIERPETRPPNYQTSGEVNGFLASCKEQLAELGYEAFWNSEKKTYKLKLAASK